MKRYIGLLIGLLVGAVLMVFGLVDGNDAWYRPHWQPTQGHVVAAEPASDPNLTRISVEYTTADGQVLQMPREFNLNRYPQFNVGNQVTVLYNPSNPLQHFIREPNTPQDMLALAALIGGAGVIAATLIRHFLKLKAERNAGLTA